MKYKKGLTNRTLIILIILIFFVFIISPSYTKTTSKVSSNIILFLNDILRGYSKASNSEFLMDEINIFFKTSKLPNYKDTCVRKLNNFDLRLDSGYIEFENYQSGLNFTYYNRVPKKGSSLEIENNILYSIFEKGIEMDVLRNDNLHYLYHFLNAFDRDKFDYNKVHYFNEGWLIDNCRYGNPDIGQISLKNLCLSDKKVCVCGSDNKWVCSDCNFNELCLGEYNDFQCKPNSIFKCINDNDCSPFQECNTNLNLCFDKENRLTPSKSDASNRVDDAKLIIFPNDRKIQFKPSTSSDIQELNTVPYLFKKGNKFYLIPVINYPECMFKPYQENYYITSACFEKIDGRLLC
jgi:hypothetical protein